MTFEIKSSSPYEIVVARSAIEAGAEGVYQISGIDRLFFFCLDRHLAFVSTSDTEKGIQVVMDGDESWATCHFTRVATTIMVEIK